MGLRKNLRKLIFKHPADTPWIDSMTSTHSRNTSRDDGGEEGSGAPPTVAAFSPNQQTATKRSRASVLIHQKSPLLVATPPQVTRALAYSHPFILPLNHLAGLLSWATGDPWESFLLLSAFWFVTLYGDNVVRWAGPLVMIMALVLGMYSRRYSPLSSTIWSDKSAKRKRAESEARKSLDEILDTLQTFTARCDVLLDPFLRLTEFLSTQSSATSATTRPALTSLFIRILAFTPIWAVLTLPPWHILTTKRVVLVIGTLGLSWHSRPIRVTRTLLWRSRTVRQIASLLTGLDYPAYVPVAKAPKLPPRDKDIKTAALSVSNNAKPGVRFTFTIYENQRRWLGLGWTASLLAYERQAWSDEHLNDCADPDHFDLPDTDHATTKWRWTPGSEWRVEGATVTKEKSAKRIGGGGGGDESGWTYFDNKWQLPSKIDGWDRYTRRRKWIRDAELVESTAGDNDDGATLAPSASEIVNENMPPNEGDSSSIDGTAKRKGWFGNKKPRRATVDRSDAASGKAISTESTRSRDSPEEDVHTPLPYRHMEWDRSIGEGVYEGLS
ncbi:hypothetical protein LTR86_002514 [Recurvomyces mirabilis]|nr:hypothetical protein LTR86_002514 [Recurvomyces mirabilis]